MNGREHGPRGWPEADRRGPQRPARPPAAGGLDPLEGENRSFTNNGVWAGTITSGYFENYLFPPDPSALTWAEHRVNYFLGSNAGKWAWGYHILWGGELHDWLSPVIFARTP